MEQWISWAALQQLMGNIGQHTIKDQHACITSLKRRYVIIGVQCSGPQAFIP